MALLVVDHLTKYFGGLAAVNDLSLEVKEGEILGFIGPNGAGKTTFFNLLSGVFPPTKGKIIFQGADITGLKPHTIAGKGLVRTFQATILFKDSTALENVVIGHHLHSRAGFWGSLFGTGGARQDKAKIEKKSLELLEIMGLAGLKDELAKNLPHGHQRALGVAMALAAEPKLLLLDEPVTGMNPGETTEMVERIRGIRGRGITVVIVEHDMKAVMGLSDRIVAVSYGRKIAEGLPQEIRENKDVIEAYLGAEEE